MKICYLPFGMHTGIRTAASADFNRFSQYSGQALLNFTLNGGIRSGQSLPPTIAGAIVANVKA
jgi:hypothetical protein